MIHKLTPNEMAAAFDKARLSYIEARGPDDHMSLVVGICVAQAIHNAKVYRLMSVVVDGSIAPDVAYVVGAGGRVYLSM